VEQNVSNSGAIPAIQRVLAIEPRRLYARKMRSFVIGLGTEMRFGA
jgi:hypothetical protein